MWWYFVRRRFWHFLRFCSFLFCINHSFGGQLHTYILHQMEGWMDGWMVSSPFSLLPFTSLQKNAHGAGGGGEMILHVECVADMQISFPPLILLWQLPTSPSPSSILNAKLGENEDWDIHTHAYVCVCVWRKRPTYETDDGQLGRNFKSGLDWSGLSLSLSNWPTK